MRKKCNQLNLKQEKKFEKNCLFNISELVKVSAFFSSCVSTHLFEIDRIFFVVITAAVPCRCLSIFDFPHALLVNTVRGDSRAGKFSTLKPCDDMKPQQIALNRTGKRKSPHFSLVVLNALTENTSFNFFIIIYHFRFGFFSLPLLLFHLHLRLLVQIPRQCAHEIQCAANAIKTNIKNWIRSGLRHGKLSAHEIKILSHAWPIASETRWQWWC